MKVHYILKRVVVEEIKWKVFLRQREREMQNSCHVHTTPTDHEPVSFSHDMVNHKIITKRKLMKGKQYTSTGAL